MVLFSFIYPETHSRNHFDLMILTDVFIVTQHIISSQQYSSNISCPHNSISPAYHVLTTLSPLPYHKRGVRKFWASENILLSSRLFTAISSFYCNWRLPYIFPNFICIFGHRSTSKILCYDFLCLPLSGCFSPAPVV